MREVVGRRYKRLLEEGKDLPDLVLIDGGKGQLGAAADALDELGLGDQPLASLAKREELIFVRGREEPIALPRASPVLQLVQRVRDEAHRFAVGYHRQARSARTLRSELDDIGASVPPSAARLLLGASARARGPWRERGGAGPGGGEGHGRQGSRPLRPERPLSGRRSARVLAAAGLAFVFAAGGAGASDPSPRFVVLISADAEWRAVRALLPDPMVSLSPFGEWFVRELDLRGGRAPVLFFHGGWGKIAAAGSTQYVIDRWKPERLVNLGTCGGFDGAVRKGDVVLVEKTVVYDIVEQMGDSAEAIAAYTTEIDLSGIPASLPKDVRRGPLVSADRDLLPADIPRLRKAYGAVAADWESGAIAWVAGRTAFPCSSCAACPTWWERREAKPTATSRPSKRGRGS